MRISKRLVAKAPKRGKYEWIAEICKLIQIAAKKFICNLLKSLSTAFKPLNAFLINTFTSINQPDFYKKY
jgi:hypothetical protein